MFLREQESQLLYPPWLFQCCLVCLLKNSCCLFDTCCTSLQYISIFTHQFCLSWQIPFTLSLLRGRESPEFVCRNISTSLCMVVKSVESLTVCVSGSDRSTSSRTSRSSPKTSGCLCLLL